MTTQNILPHVRLQFHLAHPTLESCYTEGYEFATQALPEEDNPFEMGTQENEYWAQGWWDGFYEKSMLFPSGMGSADIISIADYRHAANQENFIKGKIPSWVSTVIKIAGVIALTIMTVELIDIAS